MSAVKNELLEALSNVGGGSAVPSTETQTSPLSVKMPDGTVIEGTDASDFAGKVAAHSAKTVARPVPPPLPRAQAPTQAPPQPFVPKPVTPDSWAEQVVKDPVQANNSLLQAALGVEDPAGYIKGLEQKLAMVEQTLAVSTVERFKEQNKNFNFEQHGPVIGQLMQERNLALSVEALNWAKAEAESRGYIQPTAAPEQPPVVEAPGPQAVKTPEVLPTSGGSNDETGSGGTHLDALDAALDDPNIPFEQIDKAVRAGGFFNPGSANLLER